MVVEERGDYSCLSAKEAEIFRLINMHRGKHGLQPIAHSRSLTRVARLHAIDLVENHPEAGKDRRGYDCTMHSWSDKGFWKAVCYTGDHHYASGMWNKPREITGIYDDDGYENVYWTSSDMIYPKRVVERWMRSTEHNDLILETGKFSGANWAAMGIGVHRNVAVMWVGGMVDPLGSMSVSKENEKLLSSRQRNHDLCDIKSRN